MKAYIPVLILVISATVLFAYVRPQYDEIMVLRGEQQEYIDAITRANDIGEKRDQLLQTYRNFSQNDTERLRKALPDRTDMIQLVVDLNALAGKYNASIKDLKAGDSTTAKTKNTNIATTTEAVPYNYSTLTFTTSMNYNAFMSFLADIEKNLRIMDVSSMSLKEDDKTGNTEYIVTVKTYWLK